MDPNQISVIADANATKGEAWQCEWVDPESGTRCTIGGSLRQRGGITFFRHDCYHNPERTYSRSYDICAVHHGDFSRAHGLIHDGRRVPIGATPGREAGAIA